MPHGRLTPLGRQLASVLANLRPAAACTPLGRKAQYPRPISVDNTSRIRAVGVLRKVRDGNTAIVRGHSLAAAAVREEVEEDARSYPYQPLQFNEVEDDEQGVGRLGGIENADSTKQDWNGDREGVMGASNQSSSHAHVAFNPFFKTKGDFDTSLLRGRDYPMYYRKDNPTAELQLEAFFYRYIELRATLLRDNHDEELGSIKLSNQETELLESKKYSTTKIKHWADIITNSDHHQIVTQLAKLYGQESTEHVPLFVLFHMLRKPYMSARTLRVLLPLCFQALERSDSLNNEDIFTLFTLSLRRARDVWPTAMEKLVDMLLCYLPRKESPVMDDGVDDALSSVAVREDCMARLSSLAFRLNKAMRLLAIPTSINPFSNVVLQETCVIRILRFLAEHDPPLEVNRDGFRAVALIQLAQPKSDDDQLWAELKTLSWPPWKEERTAIDADVTAEIQGRSKAAETLERMQDAGFAPYDWERVALIYAGWDTDGTPTIQTRVRFGSGRERLRSGAAAWTARILTTRTIQEAWACYLAYEDQGDTPDHDVCLAMLRKIHEEDQRVQRTRKYKHFRRKRAEKNIWPGDAREIEPPPPSSHQHTYTRTSPPNLDDFYRRLTQRGVVFEGPCLAFLVSRAASLRLGIEYVLASEPVYPAVRGLVDDTCAHHIKDVPDVVFAGFMELLERFSNFSLSKALPAAMRSHAKLYLQSCDFRGLKINPDHAIARGSMLLRGRVPLFRPAWNALLRALGNDISLLMINAVLGSRSILKSGPTQALGKPGPAEQKFKAANTAVSIATRLIDTMHSVNLDLDAIGFMALCNVMENWVVCCWMDLRGQARTGTSSDAKSLVQSLAYHYPQLMKQLFSDFVGEADFKSVQHQSLFELPRLLEIPKPAVLHAYIRVLGWMGDYKGLLDVVQLMLRHQTDIQRRSDMDRNGDVMMRRAIVALCVFLHRSWLADTPKSMPGVPNEVTLKLDKNLEIGPTAPGREKVTLQSAKGLGWLERPAEQMLIAKFKTLVESVEVWGGWPTDEEVEAYCAHARFQQFNK